MGNQKLSTIGLVFCLISLTEYIQGTVAKECSLIDILICGTHFANSYRAAGNNHGKICSASHQLLDCLENEMAVCGTDSQSSQFLDLANRVKLARQALTQYGCGAAGLLFNLVVMVLGLAVTYFLKKIQ